MKNVWTQIARITYSEILENLKQVWTLKEMQKFHQLTQENLYQITSGKILHPVVFPNITLSPFLIIE